MPVAIGVSSGGRGGSAIIHPLLNNNQTNQQL
jgi:hypothetical protein